MVQSTIQTREVTEYNDRRLKEAGEYIKKNADIITAEMNIPVQIARNIIQKSLELHTMMHDGSITIYAAILHS